MKVFMLMIFFSPIIFAGQSYLTKTPFQTIIDKHTILKKYKNKEGFFRFRKEIQGTIKFQNYYFFDTRDLFLKKQGAVFYLMNEENGAKVIVFKISSGIKYECSLKEGVELIKKITHGKYPPHLLTEDNCSSNWSHPITELKKFISKKMKRYRPRKGGESLGVNKVSLKGKSTIIQRIIPLLQGTFYVEKILYPRGFISYLIYSKDITNDEIKDILKKDYKIFPSDSNKSPIDITLDILENNEGIINSLMKNKLIIR